MMDERNFYITIRASLIRQAKLLEQERACLMEQITAIEKRWNIERNERTRQVVTTENDTIAAATMVEV